MVLIVRSTDALRPLTLCNCDCMIITTAIWLWPDACTPAQRCISSRQLTDNIFEEETIALDHVSCHT